jgi:hypothetical protein
MTKRQQASFLVSIALGFAITARDKGLKGYKRAVTCLSSALDQLDEGLTDKQKSEVWHEIDKFVDTQSLMTAYDYLDKIVEAMDIIKYGKQRWINSLLALSAINVEEETE